MNDLIEQLDAFEIKIRKLVLLNQQLKTENQELKATRTETEAQLNQRIEAQEAIIAELKAQIATSESISLDEATAENSADGIKGINNAKAIQREIDKYVRKIDKLIEWIEHS
jgi:TolA-binding protein